MLIRNMMLIAFAFVLVNNKQSFAQTQPVSKPNLTSIEAIQRASEFCQQIGAPVTGTGIAKYPADENCIVRSYWQQRWSVVFPGQAELEIVDATKIVCVYNNLRLFDELGKDTRPAGPAVSELVAINHATAALTATGQVDQLQFSNANLKQDSSPAYYGTSTWYVYWQRIYQGLRYREEHASVVLQAETGQVKMIVLMFPSVPPSAHANVMLRPSNRLSLEQIENHVREFLAAHGVSNAVLQSSELEIVRPSVVLQGNGNPHSNGTSQFAYVLRFAVDDQIHDIWVDPTTGTVINEEISTFRKSAYLHGPIYDSLPLLEILKKSSVVQIYAYNRQQGWMPTPFVVLSAQSNPDMLHLLQTTSKDWYGSSRGMPSMRFVFTIQDKKPIEIFYEGGMLGANGYWVILPAGFDTWLKNLKALSEQGTISPSK